MSVAEVKQAVVNFSPDDFSAFRNWLADLEMAQWDKEIEEDSAAGRLDSMLEKALGDYHAGRASDI
jgi:hypothetical protein